ncbi:hypothetical protein ACMGE7_01885 [Macrococcus equi]|uniref:hypothetical protein n=1 Tax=Macrococcus equi TaxID=3395462 RepID=UPI0039BDD45C
MTKDNLYPGFDNNYEQISEQVFNEIKAYIDENYSDAHDKVLKKDFTLDIEDDGRFSLVYVNFDTDKYIFDEIEYKEENRLFVNARSIANIIGEIVVGGRIEFSEILVIDKDKPILRYGVDELKN